jgi:hypothetical protein
MYLVVCWGSFVRVHSIVTLIIGCKDTIFFNIRAPFGRKKYIIWQNKRERRDNTLNIIEKKTAAITDRRNKRIKNDMENFA